MPNREKLGSLGWGQKTLHISVIAEMRLDCGLPPSCLNRNRMVKCG